MHNLCGQPEHKDLQAQFDQALDAALRRRKDDFLPAAEYVQRAGLGHYAEVNVPVLATLHLPCSFYPVHSFEDIPPNVSFNCVSGSQSRSFAGLNAMLGIVPNGIPLDSFEPPAESRAEQDPVTREGLLWLGRICQEKAPHLALEIAGRAGLPITLAGQVYPFSYHQQYFDREVVPRLRQIPNATFVPAPSFAIKRDLLRHTKALLITSLAEETSSLVAMEAAASGTPVVAFRRGALPEVVKDHVTGFMVEDVASAVDACTASPGLTFTRSLVASGRDRPAIRAVRCPARRRRTRCRPRSRRRRSSPCS
jgi:glycosyltransferase involved in cell wall biosynthesis